MTISDKLTKLLNNIDDAISREMLTYDGNYNADFFDITGANNLVSYKQGKHQHRSKVGSLVKSMFGNKYSDKDIWKFVEAFKREHDGLDTFDDSAEGDDFKWVSSTFKKLTSETYPHGTEDAVVPLLGIGGLQKDSCDNYYKIIPGDTTTMFTSHLDTASFQKQRVGYRVGKDSKGQIFAYTDGKSILGADDKAGVTIMLWMMKHKVPGIYYFFIGEERGMIGSGYLSDRFSEQTHLKDVTKCISFDRRDYHSVITHQMGRQCCSPQFADSLISELNKNGMKVEQDPTGVYTDSASFVGLIPECTNISVGYFGEHSTSEKQNLNHLTLLCNACIKVNWKDLVIGKAIGFSASVKERYAEMIKLLKYNNISNGLTFEEENNTLVIYLEIESHFLEDLQRDIQIIHTVLSRGGHDYTTDIIANVVKIKMIN